MSAKMRRDPHPASGDAGFMIFNKGLKIVIESIHLSMTD
jgi:hypothetical protein